MIAFVAALPIALLLPQAGCGREDRGPPLVTAFLLAASEAAPAGGTVELGLRLLIADGWHVYWRGCSDSGAPLEIALELPPGSEAGEWRWPAPERHLSPGGILDHVYEREVLVSVPVTIPSSARGTTWRATAQASWMVCREVCLPGEVELRIELPVVDASARIPPSTAAAQFAAAAERVPEPAGPADALRVQVRPDALTIEAPGASGLAFYPEAACELFTDLVAAGVARGSRLELTLRAPEMPTELSGVLAIERAGGPPAFRSLAFTLPAETIAEPMKNEPAPSPGPSGG